MADAQGKFVAAEPLFEDLPRGWASTTLGQLGTWSGGGTPSKSEPAFWTNGTVPWVSAKDMKVDRLTDSEDHVTPDAVAKSAAKYIPPESVLMVTRSGILAHTFPVAVTAREVTINQDLKALTPATGCDANYVAWFLRSRNTHILKELSKDGTTVASIDTDRLKALRVPLPPTAEQRRIVSRIDELFSRIEAGERAIAAARADLKRYRKSILKAAVTGTLTADWRETAPRSTNTGHDVLDALIAERSEAGLKPAKLCDASGLPQLPRTWAWGSLDQLSAPVPHSIVDGPFGSKLKSQHYRNAGTRVVRLENIGDGVFNNKISFIDPEHAATLWRHQIRSGDLAIASLGEILPRVCIVPASFGSGIVKADCIKCTPHPKIGAAFVSFWLQSTTLRSRVMSLIRGVGRPRLNLDDIRRFPVPIPPLNEITEIVSRVEADLSRIHHSEETLDAQVSSVRALKQSILKAAFEGLLVPQNPNDEPAADILARLAGETSVLNTKMKARA